LEMKVQVYGAGVAGSFLYMLLARDFEVAVKDLRSEPDCRCAWGTIYGEARKLYREAGINFDEYVLARPKYVIINGARFKNVQVVTFDKRRLLRDVWSQIEFDEVEADLIVDATGYERAFLPRIENDALHSTIQYVEEHGIEENIYVYARRTGFAWAFPLGDGRWHVGAGETSMGRALELLNVFREKYGFEEKAKRCACEAKVRLLPPLKCKPFISGNVVGVGEAIGCVSGFGEGNLPALQSAKILYECLKKGSLQEYENKILKEFDWIEATHELVKKFQASRKFALLRLLSKVKPIEIRRTAKPFLERLNT